MSKVEPGAKFNSLTVVEIAERVKYEGRPGTLIRWRCRCDCGGEIIAQASALKSGGTRMCRACLKNKPKITRVKREERKIISPGDVIGRLTVVNMMPKGIERAISFECVCSCGTATVVTANNLKSGNTKSCGCLHKDLMSKRGRQLSKTQLIVGSQIGKLTVMEELPRQSGQRVSYRCLCSCGNEIITQAWYLRNGDTKSCGCLHVERTSLAHRQKAKIQLSPGMIFGHLEILEVLPYRPGVRVACHCLCECGNETVVTTDQIRSGKTRSCGCLMLNDNKVFLEGHSVDDLKNYYYSQVSREKAFVESDKILWTLDMLKLLKQTQQSCAVCGRLDMLCVDHVLPISNGNVLAPGNAIVLCWVHNSSKNNKDLSSLPPDVRDKILSAASSFLSAWQALHPVN